MNSAEYKNHLIVKSMLALTFGLSIGAGMFIYGLNWWNATEVNFVAAVIATAGATIMVAGGVLFVAIQWFIKTTAWNDG